MLVCGLIIFELAAIIVLLVVSIRNTKKLGDSCGIDMAAQFAVLDNLNKNICLKFDIISAGIDKTNRNIGEFKTDIDVKFGPDLVKRLNAIFKLGEHPSGLMVKDGKVVKINRDY